VCRHSSRERPRPRWALSLRTQPQTYPTQISRQSPVLTQRKPLCAPLAFSPAARAAAARPLTTCKSQALLGSRRPSARCTRRPWRARQRRCSSLLRWGLTLCSVVHALSSTITHSLTLPCDPPPPPHTHTHGALACTNVQTQGLLLTTILQPIQTLCRLFIVAQPVCKAAASEQRKWTMCSWQPDASNQLCSLTDQQCCNYVVDYVDHGGVPSLDVACQQYAPGDCHTLYVDPPYVPPPPPRARGKYSTLGSSHGSTTLSCSAASIALNRGVSAHHHHHYYYHHHHHHHHHIHSSPSRTYIGTDTTARTHKCTVPCLSAALEPCPETRNAPQKRCAAATRRLRLTAVKLSPRRWRALPSSLPS
jgi:hypothetical protein